MDLYPFLLQPHHCAAAHQRLWVDVGIVFLCHARFPSSLRQGLTLDVRLASLCQACSPPSLRERLRLDVRLVSLSVTTCPFVPKTGVVGL
jgi:hypothetical protein